VPRSEIHPRFSPHWALVLQDRPAGCGLQKRPPPERAFGGMLRLAGGLPQARSAPKLLPGA